MFVQAANKRLSYFEPTQQDSSDDENGSDTTEVSPYRPESGRQWSPKPGRIVDTLQAQRARKRTIILELLEEVQGARKRADTAEMQREESVRLYFCEIYLFAERGILLFRYLRYNCIWNAGIVNLLHYTDS